MDDGGRDLQKAVSQVVDEQVTGYSSIRCFDALQRGDEDIDEVRVEVGHAVEQLEALRQKEPIGRMSSECPITTNLSDLLL